MADAGTVLARLQAALSVYDASWDVSAGSATYKILESVAQEISAANNNSVLQTYSYDVNTKSGQQLDVFCNLFGVYRQLGKRASGTVTFGTTGTDAALTIIPVGTQVVIPIGSNNGNPSAVYYVTTNAAVITPGATTVQVPVMAVLPGANSNAPASTISQLVGSILNVTTVTNDLPITGGTDPESDAEFRNRWQNTAFNNTTGTYGKYIVTSLQNQNVLRANALGQQNYWDEQCQISSTIISGTGTATLLLVAYSGMKNLYYNTPITSGTVIASSGFPASATGATVASGLNTLLDTWAPGNTVTITASPSGNTITNGFNLSYSDVIPYRLMLGFGNSIPSGVLVSNGVTTVSGTKYWEWIQSANPDVGTSGTMSYVNAQVSGLVGYLFPQGNELVGENLNTSAQTIYSNTTDYYYPTGQPSLPLTITIANQTNDPLLFAGNTIELISEYCPASSRSQSLTDGNYVDVFIDGTTSNTVKEQVALVISGSMTMTSGNPTSYLNTTNYVFADGQSASNASGTISNANNDYYVWLNQQPLINVPSQISVATSGIADTFYLYNSTNGTGYNVPIALNNYNTISFKTTLPSGYNYTATNFLPVPNANLTLYPGLALASGTVATSGQFYIKSVTTSGIYLNRNITGGTYTAATGTTITISGKALAYPLYDITNYYGSVNSIAGIGVDSVVSLPGWPALDSGNKMYITYSHGYNQDVVDVDALIQQSRPIGTNVLVHQATFVNLSISLTIVAANGTSQSSIESNVNSSISKYLSNFGYNQSISFASIGSSVMSAGNILNVRVNSVSVVSIDGTVQLPTKTSDFVLASNQLPVLYNVSYTYKGATNF